MPLIKYRDKKFSEEKLKLIDIANSIISEYDADNIELTLRQLYYQFVARDYIPNTQKDYKKLGDLISDARLAGLLDWDSITDRTRNLARNSNWESPKQIVEACINSYRIDKWEGQKHRVEVWIEKDALVGVIEGVCGDLDVPYFSCRGYTSQSEMWAAAQRLRGYRKQGQHPIILHLGDHDPSGRDMTRDIEDRLAMFGVQGLEVTRIALNMDQIEKYRPPPNPAKIEDPRATRYIKEFGRSSWELDALDPKTIRELIHSEVRPYIDPRMLKKRKEQEEQDRQQLKEIVGVLE